MQRVFALGLLLLALTPCTAENAADLQRALSRIEPGTYHRADWVWHTNYALAELSLKQATLLRGGGFIGNLDGAEKQVVAAGMASLQRLERREQPPLRAGALNELAYITENDLTAQPYHLYLPPGYDGKRQWPLIVFLHGYVPSTSVVDPWLPVPEHCEVAGKHGCLLLVPYGRRNTDFQGVGEVDVLASLRQVRQVFNVDPDRIYLSGVSMGGMGAWNIALRHPGLFAAVTPMCGQTDMFRWWGWPREQAPPWKRWLIEWDNALDQVPNVRNQNIFVQHGELDNLIPVEQTRLMVEAARQQGTPIKCLEQTGESHYIYFRTESYENAWSWEKQFTLDRSPRRVDLKLYSLEYNQAFWLTVDALGQWGTPGTVTAEVSPEKEKLSLTTDNVTAVTIDSRTARLPEGCTFVWNGQPVAGQPGPDGTIALRPEAPPPPPLQKRRGLCGPCEEVFDTRFLLVQGTAGDEAADAELARRVGLWQAEWDQFADGPPPAKLDTELTEDDLQQCNLVLFGTPQTNSVLARMADRLPVRIGDHRYDIGGKTYEGAHLGLVMCYPNPLNPNRYVLIYSGERHGERLSVNHKHDLLPDFVVFTTDSFGRDDTNDALCAGFFGMDWQLHPALTWEPTAQQGNL
ncbi:prolyl oligopeptidase family serine peptidase [bacterium]|nr:prolyl oligopeptidase family serine peptidase [bacterium]